MKWIYFLFFIENKIKKKKKIEVKNKKIMFIIKCILNV